MGLVLCNLFYYDFVKEPVLLFLVSIQILLHILYEWAVKAILLTFLNVSSHSVLVFFLSLF